MTLPAGHISREPATRPASPVTAGLSSPVSRRTLEYISPVLSTALPMTTPSVADPRPVIKLSACSGSAASQVRPLANVCRVPGILESILATLNLIPAFAPAKANPPTPAVATEVSAIVARLGTCLMASLIPQRAYEPIVPCSCASAQLFGPLYRASNS